MIELQLCGLSAAFPLGDVVPKSLETDYPIEPDLRKVGGIAAPGSRNSDVQSKAWPQTNTDNAGGHFRAALSLPGRDCTFRRRWRGIRGGASVADVARDIFLGLGLGKGRLLLEGAPRNTSEEVAMAYDLAQCDLGCAWILAMSALHIRRALSSFCAAGSTTILSWPAGSGRPSSRISEGWTSPTTFRTYILAIESGAAWSRIASP